MLILLATFTYQFSDPATKLQHEVLVPEGAYPGAILSLRVKVVFAFEKILHSTSLFVCP